MKVARIVSTQKANRAARFSAARFIARHIEVETPRLGIFCLNGKGRSKYGDGSPIAEQEIWSYGTVSVKSKK